MVAVDSFALPAEAHATAWADGLSRKAPRRWRPTTRGALPLGHPAPVGAGHRGHHQSGPAPVVRWQLAWEPVTVATPVAGVALLSGRGVRAGGSVELGAWDVEIVAEA
jgi:hypothetical protein